MKNFNPTVFPILIAAFLCWDGPFSFGQSLADTVLSLPAVEISTFKIRHQTVGSSTQHWTGSDLEKLPANNVAELLSAASGTYIKSYGQGSLATSSIRGGSAGHTLVLWNGLPIHSPMLGLLDLSLLPLRSVESVGFTPGGNTAMWGSGAIGGVLNLDNQGDFSQYVKAKSNIQIGSFGQFQQHIRIGIGNKKIQCVTHVSHLQADNEFSYFLADGLPERKQTNARLSQQAILQDVYWKWNDRQQVTVHFWRQHSDRQIPPTNVQNRSLAHQNDLATRLMLDYSNNSKNGLWKIKTGYFDEYLDYFDDLIRLESRSHFRTFIGEITGQWKWREHHQFFLGNTHSYTRAWSAGYRENIPTEYRTAAFGSWKYSKGKLEVQTSLRQEFVDSTRVPLVPAVGFEYKIAHAFVLKGKVSRNYRLPTLNDRFWKPGGNPDLLPEAGWSQELTLAKTQKGKNMALDISLTAFNRNMDDWILWSLPEGQSFWSANNITKVWSRGGEARASIVYFLKKVKFQLRGGYDYVRSTNQIALENPKLEAGEQLIYTPVHQAHCTFSLEWKSLYFAYQHTFTGAVDGINDRLDAFQVGNVRLQCSGSYKNSKANLFVNLNNIWDADYLVVERRPMPGINFQAGVQLAFSSKRKKW